MKPSAGINVTARQTKLKLEGITKTFPGVVANDEVNLEVTEGEVHGLLGENGAGKSTLMNILTGVYKADRGRIYLNGKPVTIKGPRDALDLGLCMVHQHLSLVERLTVGDNLILARIAEAPPVLDLKSIESKIAQLEEEYGLKFPDLRTKIWQLSMGERQRVEIIRALYRGASLLILDDPTSLLTPVEVKQLAASLRRMVQQGLAIIFITHKLGEVMSFTDRVTVLRRGKAMGTMTTSEVTESQLVRLMIGSEIGPRELHRAEELAQGAKAKPVLEITDLSALDDEGLPAVRGLSLSTEEREILGIAGVAGNGQKELAEVLVGLRKSTGGKVVIKGRDVTNKSPKEVAKMSVSYVPEERQRYGVARDLSVGENLILKLYDSKTLTKNGFIDNSKMRSFAEKQIKEFNIAAPSPNLPAKHLSGGNLQKLILARELSQSPSLLIAANPTGGLDVGATDFIHSRLVELRDAGTSVLLISEDLQEVMGISDRIAVMSEGRIVGVFPSDRANIEEIGLLMAAGRK